MMGFKTNAILSMICIFSLAACSETVTADTIYSSEAALTALETVADQYAKGDFGTPDESIVIEAKALDDQAEAIMVKLRTAAQNGQAISTSENVALTTAISALKTFLINKKIVAPTN